jgi:DNA-binding MarR family transcriptional regulator
MSRQSEKRRLFLELIDEIRRSQGATARFDSAVAEALGLNRTDMRCVDALERTGPMTAGQLAETTGLTSGAMTTALDRLERAGFVRRIRDDQDRRRVLVEITERAHAVAGQFYVGHAAMSERLFREHTAEEIDLMLNITRRGRRFNEERATEVEQENRERGAGWARSARSADAPGAADAPGE